MSETKSRQSDPIASTKKGRNPESVNGSAKNLGDTQSGAQSSASQNLSEDQESVQWPQWDCQWDNPSQEGWTVGAAKLLSCKGDYTERLSESAQFEFLDEPLKYTLHILEVQHSDNTSAQFLVTGYKPGRYGTVPMRIVDREAGKVHKVELSPLSWEVSSVIDKGQQQQPQPFGPIGPFTLSMPWWYWASWVLGVLVIAGFLFLWVRKVLQRKRILEELAKHSTALSPYNQFNKDIRVLVRKYSVNLEKKSPQVLEEYLRGMDEVFRLYLVRFLLVPAQDWSRREILLEIKRRHFRVHDEAGEGLRQVLVELEKALKGPESVSALDCEQLVHMVRHVAEKIYQAKRVKR